MRIAVAGIGHETNTFSTLRTRLDDFWIRRGDECLAGEAWGRFPDIEWAPCLLAGATPNGLVEESTYQTLKAELLQCLKDQLPVDGLYLSLHGAMHVDGVGDGETDLLRAIREVTGPDLPISVSLDLHGNLSPELVSSVNMMTALRTAPHIDGLETRVRALNLLVRAILEGKRLSTSMVKLPLLLPGEYAVTAIEPSLSLYTDHIKAIEKMPGIWDASLMIGCAWTDSPYTSVSTLVVSEDRLEGERLAEEYAEHVWEKRREFAPEVAVKEPDEAIRYAKSYSKGPLFISESGDNVTAGGAGDVSWFLEKLIQADLQDALYAGITDPSAVNTCSEASIGDTVHLSLGGRLDAVNCKPLPVQGELKRVADGIATVQIGGIAVLITDGRRSFHTLAAFEPSGIDPLSKKVVIVKQGYLAPELAARSSETFLALTPGFTDLRIPQLPYKAIRRPIYPLDPDCKF